MRTLIVMEEHYIGCQYFTSFVQEWTYVAFLVFRKQYTSNIIVVPRCMNSTIRTDFLSQKTVAISFLADNVYLNFFGLCGECVCIHWFDCTLVSSVINETQIHLLL
jgi:hypothetical protein